MKSKIYLLGVSIILIFALSSCSNNQTSSTVNSISKTVSTQVIANQSETKAATLSTTKQETTVKATVKATLAPTQAQASAIMVHITKTGDKYHRSGCKYLSKSDIEVTLDQALAKGLTPCSVCNPPTK